MQLSYRKVISRVSLLYCGLLVATLALQSVCSVLIHAAFPAFEQSSWYLWVVSYVPLYGVAFPLFLLLARRLAPHGPAPTPRPLALRSQGRILILAFGAMYTGSLVTSLVMLGVGALRGSPVQNPTAVMQENSNVWANLIFGCILAPVGEEIMFRKTLYEKIGLYGERVYILVGAGLFALFHANFSQMLYAYLAGMVFCFAYSRTGELLYTIGIHILVNLVGMVILPLAVNNSVAAAALSLLVYACLIYAWVLFFRLRREISLQPGPQSPGEHALRSSLLNFGMLINLLLTLAISVITLFPELVSGLEATAGL